MTYLARYPIRRLFFGWIVRIKGKMAKYFALAPLLPGLIARHWHMAYGTLVFNRSLRLRMIDRFSPHARLPIRIARRIGHNAGPPFSPDGNILSGWRDQANVAGKTTVGGLERRIAFSIRGLASSADRSASQENRNHAANLHRHPSNNPPSARS